MGESRRKGGERSSGPFLSSPAIHRSGSRSPEERPKRRTHVHSASGERVERQRPPIAQGGNLARPGRGRRPPRGRPGSHARPGPGGDPDGAGYGPTLGEKFWPGSPGEPRAGPSPGPPYGRAAWCGVLRLLLPCRRGGAIPRLRPPPLRELGRTGGPSHAFPPGPVFPATSLLYSLLLYLFCSLSLRERRTSLSCSTITEKSA